VCSDPGGGSPRAGQALAKGTQTVRVAIRRRPGAEKPNHRHRRLLRASRDGPRRNRAAEQRDELAPLHSITSSAATSKPGGTVRPSIRAVWALMTRSNFVDWTTGRSAGLAPFKMRPT
jgi:hypothetical protein